MANRVTSPTLVPKDPPQKICGNCGKEAKIMQTCGRCRITTYCDKACQTAGWPTHKLVCKTVSERKEDIEKIQQIGSTYLNSLEQKYGNQPNQNQELLAKQRRLRQLDEEMRALIKTHPNQELIEQRFLGTVPLDKLDKQENKIAKALTSEQQIERDKINRELEQKIDSNRAEYTKILQSMNLPPFVETLRKKVQQIIDSKLGGDLQKSAEKIIELLPLIETSKDNEHILNFCLKKAPKEAVENWLKRYWQVHQLKDIPERETAWKAIFLCYEEFIKALTDQHLLNYLMKIS